MPLEQLKIYQGSHPIPADFNEFWEERLEEVYKQDLKYEITKRKDVNFVGCEFYDFNFIGIDGSKLYAKFIKPTSEEPVGAILQFHGYPGSSRSFFEQLSHVGMGYAVIALDCGGQGGKSEDLGSYVGTTVSGHIVMGLEGEPKDMYYVKLFQNLCMLCRIVSQLDEIDHNKIFANGASQGAALALVCTALNPIIKKCAALYPFLSDYKRVWDMDLDVVAYEGLRYYMKWFDPMHEKMDEIFTKLGYIDVKNFAPKVKADVLFGTGLMDNICPPSTQFAVFNALNGPKKHLLFPDYTHEEIFAFDDLLIDFFCDTASVNAKEDI